MSDFPSKYSNGKSVSAAQYIAEMVCERIAKKNKKDLHYRFWVSEEWQKEYKGQITAAHKILKNFDAKAVINALLTDDGRKIYSLRAQHLMDMIRKQQTILDNTPEPVLKNIERNLFNKGKMDIKSNNILDKLRDIDGSSTR
jgi:ribosomal protein S25